MRDAHIVLADTPADILMQASAKRRLWQALRSLRRALAAEGR
jgi:FPC/CPF motif-containing protein YcgG